jgi:hypothetical protein
MWGAAAQLISHKLISHVLVIKCSSPSETLVGNAN